MTCDCDPQSSQALPLTCSLCSTCRNFRKCMYKTVRKVFLREHCGKLPGLARQPLQPQELPLQYSASSFIATEQIFCLWEDRVLPELAGTPRTRLSLPRGAPARRDDRITCQQCGLRSLHHSPSSKCPRRPPVRDWFSKPMRRSCPSQTGSELRKSINSTFTPCSRSSFCAACRARGTTAP